MLSGNHLLVLVSATYGRTAEGVDGIVVQVFNKAMFIVCRCLASQP